MKLIISLVTVLSVFTVSCGPTKNNPLENYKHLNLSADAQAAPQRIEYRLVTETVEKPVVQEKIVEVEVQVPVVQQQLIYVNACPEALLVENEGNYNACVDRIKQTGEQISVNGIFNEVKTFSDAGLQHEEAMIFTEGVESTYYINAKILYRSKVKFEVTIDDEPTSAMISEVSNQENSVTYKITWKPQGVLAAGETEDKANIRIALADFQYIDASAYNNNIMQVTFDALSNLNSTNGKKEISVLKEIVIKKAGATSTSGGTASAPKAEYVAPMWGPQ